MTKKSPPAGTDGTEPDATGPGPEKTGRRTWTHKPKRSDGRPAYGKNAWPPRSAAPKAAEDERDTTPVIFGFHAVEAALANPLRKINLALLTENAENRLATALAARDVPIERVHPRDLDRRLGPDTVHQGALLEVAPLREPSMNELARKAAGRPLVVLDQVTDPHNVGAVLRSAAVFGCAGIIMTRRNSPPLSGVLAKSASGALELVPVATVQNLARGLADLKAVGFTIIGLDGEVTDSLETMVWPEKVALVLGAEGRGLRQLTRETCDHLACIVTDGQIASLNVSNAAAIALHTGLLKRRQMLPTPSTAPGAMVAGAE
jgi:23S rRNA (guanosine2251-2'-O)-methyltransferase